MNQENENVNVQPQKKKRRFPIWLAIVLIIVLFAGGVLAGLKLATAGDLTDMLNNAMPGFMTKSSESEDKAATMPDATPAVNVEAKQTPAPSSTPAVIERPKASPTPTAKPTPSPAATDKPVNSPEPSATAEPTPPAESPKPSPESPEAPVAGTMPMPSAAPIEPMSQYISIDEALDATFKHAKVTASQAEVYKVHRERSEGILVYEIEFRVEDRDYSYEINAADGKVEGWEIEREKKPTVEVSGPDGIRPSSSNIPEIVDMEAAKITAFKHCGADEKDVQSFRATLELDSLTLVYDMEFKYKGYRYDYEIDAVTGELISCEKEKI